MKRLLTSLFLLAGLSFGGLTSAADYERLDKPVAPETAPGRVVVQQFLWHRCIHCYHLEPDVDRWLTESKPGFIDFERVPVVWDRAQFEQSSYYGLAKVMRANGELSDEQVEEINAGLFTLNFVDKKEFNAANVYPLFLAHGVASLESFNERLASEAVEAQRMRSYDLTRSYRIRGVPMFVVNGKYVIGLDTLEGERSPDKLFATINRLAEQELDRQKRL